MKDVAQRTDGKDLGREVVIAEAERMEKALAMARSMRLLAKAGSGIGLRKCFGRRSQ